MLVSCASLRWGMPGCHALRVRRRDLEADAKRRAAEVPAYALQEAGEAIEAANPHGGLPPTLSATAAVQTA
jgi:hypothetical protein